MDPILPALMVFSPLRWNAPLQRPQQLIARLAGRWRITFVEEPVTDPGPPRLEVRPVSDELQVMVPHLPGPRGGFEDARLPALLRHHARRHGLEGAAAWLYTPLALPLADAVSPACLAFDCMQTHPDWRAQEEQLLRRAALVLAAGPSLHEALRARHAPIRALVHGLPNAVDATRFDPARLDRHGPEAARAQALLGDLPRPRLGFYGLIDDHLDTALVARLADAHPSWSVVMVGPLCGIDPAALPQRPNLHWLGPQPDALLPHLLAQWDLALLPYAAGGAGAFANPPQTLEYMAGEKPIVATAVPDVVALYGSMVEIAQSAGDFVLACERVLAERVARRCARVMDMLTTVSTQSWDRTADVVHGLLLQALQQAQRTTARRTTPPPRLVAGVAH